MASGTMKQFQVYFLSSVFVGENQLHTRTAGEMGRRLYPSYTQVRLNHPPLFRLLLENPVIGPDCITSGSHLNMDEDCKD